jgi:cytochrome c-type biogenesis protein CcmE
MSVQQGVARGSASTEEETRLGNRFTRKQLVVAGVLGAAVLLWLVLFLSLGGDFYQTVDEARAAGPQQNVRVGGVVSPGSVTDEGDTVSFALEGDAGETVDVVYTGEVPASLGPLSEVVAAGDLDASGRLSATEVLVKCPDKLFPEKATNRLLEGVGLERILY